MVAGAPACAAGRVASDVVADEQHGRDPDRSRDKSRRRASREEDAPQVRMHA